MFLFSLAVGHKAKKDLNNYVEKPIVPKQAVVVNEKVQAVVDEPTEIVITEINEANETPASG